MNVNYVNLFNGINIELYKKQKKVLISKLQTLNFGSVESSGGFKWVLKTGAKGQRNF